MQAKQIISYILLGLSILSILSGITYMVVNENRIGNIKEEFAEKMSEKTSDQDSVDEKRLDKDSFKKFPLFKRPSGRRGDIQGFSPSTMLFSRLPGVLLVIGFVFLMAGVVLLISVKIVA